MSLLEQLDNSFFEYLPTVVAERRRKIKKELLEKEHYGQNDDHIIRIHSTPVSKSGESNMWVTEEFSILDPSCLSEEEQEVQDDQEKSNEAPFPWMSVAFVLSLYVYYYRWDTLFH